MSSHRMLPPFSAPKEQKHEEPLDYHETRIQGGGGKNTFQRKRGRLILKWGTLKPVQLPAHLVG